MTPNYAIFRQVFAECLAVYSGTYDYLPDASAEYPFFYVGESTTTEEENLELYGECIQTVHIYALRTDRKKFEELTEQLLDALRLIKAAFDYHVTYKTCTPRDIPDNTDIQPLIHRVLDIRFSYVKK